jgi:predicted DCC family thiol-disulfide oxidoreductase YuxK
MITLIFDGDCAFCTSSVNFTVKHSNVKFETIPYQWAKLEKFNLTAEQTQKKVYLNVDGKNFAGAKAVSKLMRLDSNWILKIIGAIAAVPPFSWVADLLYWLVATNRHRLPGGTPACKMPNSN